MTYRGYIKNGVVVLEGSTVLEEGTAVRVEPIEGRSQLTGPGTPQAILQNPARWHGEEQEVERLLDELRRMKQEELLRQSPEDE